MVASYCPRLRPLGHRSSSYCKVALSTDHQRPGQTAGDPSGDLQPAALSALHVLFANGNMRSGPSAHSFD
ncbi:hypothetical protein EVAR_11625_1 [Eumeta japonica]|uniref:Uncharacterized protein n=1 Tax=Eumeta variegata TaxID=151549 RepID=A0A4C1WVE2_EUMVA|nr:hypothetical protein EVAR_11625_1 [Eumeta japonica]